MSILRFYVCVCVFNIYIYLSNLAYLFSFGCAESSLLRAFFCSCSEGTTLRLWLLIAEASFVGEHRLNSCVTWAELFLSLWDLLRSGVEPVSPEVAGRFFTSEPPAKSLDSFWKRLGKESSCKVGPWVLSSLDLWPRTEPWPQPASVCPSSKGGGWRGGTLKCCS